MCLAILLRVIEAGCIDDHDPATALGVDKADNLDFASFGLETVSDMDTSIAWDEPMNCKETAWFEYYDPQDMINVVPTDDFPVPVLPITLLE